MQDDKEVLQQGRRNKLKGAEASLRDQIPAKLVAKLRETDIAEKIDKTIHLGDADRNLWLERQKEYLKNWDEFLESTAEGAFEGSSSLHIPLPLIVARALHARFVQAILGVEPYFSLRARTEGQMERASLVTDVLTYALKTWCNYHQGIDPAIDTWIWNWVTTGTGILKLRWDAKYETFLDIVEEIVEDLPKYRVREDGTEELIPQTKKREREAKVTKKCFEGPVFEVVDAEDLLIIGGGGDPQLADSVHHTQWLTASELWTLVDREIFDEEAVQKVIDAGPDNKATRPGTDIKYMRARFAGFNVLDTEADLDRYEIVESYVNHDVDGSGINSKVVVWTHRRTREMLRATYLRRISKSGEVPFYKIDFHRRPGQTYGVGAIEMLFPLSKEIDAMHNIRVDSGMVSNLPMFFYRATSSLANQELQFQPGAGIPVDDPQRDVVIPQWGNKTSTFLQEEQLLQQMVERMFGISDLNLGVMSGAQGATRTASGVRALMGESNANLDIFLRRLNRGWGQALRGLLHMLQQRIPAGLSFRITGESGQDYWRYVRSQEDLAGDFDLELSANSANSNKMVQLELANQIMQVTSNPLDFQLGIVTPAQRYEALANWYKQNGVREYRRYVQAPPEYQYILTPQEEIQRITRGMDVPVMPNSDHQGFLAAFEEIMASDELLGSMNEQQTVALAAQAQKHQQMLAALQAQAAQQANMAQQQTNSMAASAQASPGANPMGADAAAQGVASEAQPGANPVA